MTFTDDFAGLTRAQQITLVQAVACEHGDQLTNAEAAQTLSLYATRVADDAQHARAALVRHQHTITSRHGELSAGCLPYCPCPDLAIQPDRQPEAGA